MQANTHIPNEGDSLRIPQRLNSRALVLEVQTYARRLYSIEFTNLSHSYQLLSILRPDDLCRDVHLASKKNPQHKSIRKHEGYTYF